MKATIASIIKWASLAGFIASIIKWASLAGFIASILLAVFSSTFFALIKGFILAVVTFVCYIYFGVDEEY